MTNAPNIRPTAVFSLSTLGHGGLDCHPVLYFLHSVYFFVKLGCQVHFGCVGGFAAQFNRPLLRLDLCIEGAGLAIIEERHRHFLRIFRIAGFFSPISMCIFFILLNCSSVKMPRISFIAVNISR
jgi:hypothetical protein